MTSLKDIKKILSVSFTLILLAAVLFPAEASFAGVKKYSSKGAALKPYSVRDYKPVNNKKLKPLNIKSFYTYSMRDISMPHILGTKAGTKKIELQTLFHLPKTWDTDKAYYDLGNPQSLSVTPDGNTAYVTHSDGKKGYIVKYDLKKLRELELNVPGRMQGLRYPWSFDDYQDDDDDDDWNDDDYDDWDDDDGDEYDDEYDDDDNRDDDDKDSIEKQIRSCVTIGPKFKMGHGAACSYNPKDKCLWFVTKTMSQKTDLWRVNMKTLKPDLCINYTFSNSIGFGNNITFDKKGRIYHFQYTSSKQGICPESSVKIYQGKINLKAKKKVSFKLMWNVIMHPIAANHNLQAAGYDHKNNRVYLVCNSGLMSVPVGKLVKDKVKPSDVWMTQFNVNREFEDFEVDKNGNYYLLVNKYPEIMTNQDLARWQLSKKDFNKYGEYIDPTHN